MKMALILLICFVFAFGADKENNMEQTTWKSNGYNGDAQDQSQNFYSVSYYYWFFVLKM